MARNWDPRCRGCRTGISSHPQLGSQASRESRLHRCSHVDKASKASLTFEHVRSRQVRKVGEGRSLDEVCKARQVRTVRVHTHPTAHTHTYDTGTLAEGYKVHGAIWSPCPFQPYSVSLVPCLLSSHVCRVRSPLSPSPIPPFSISNFLNLTYTNCTLLYITRVSTLLQDLY